MAAGRDKESSCHWRRRGWRASEEAENRRRVDTKAWMVCPLGGWRHRSPWPMTQSLGS